MVQPKQRLREVGYNPTATDQPFCLVVARIIRPGVFLESGCLRGTIISSFIKICNMHKWIYYVVPLCHPTL
jgi:hypothetical protein